MTNSKAMECLFTEAHFLDVFISEEKCWDALQRRTFMLRTQMLQSSNEQSALLVTEK